MSLINPDVVKPTEPEQRSIINPDTVAPSKMSKQEIKPSITPSLPRERLPLKPGEVKREDIKKLKLKQTSTIGGKPAHEHIVDLLNNPPEDLGDRAWHNYPEKVIGDYLYYQKITLEDVRNLQNVVDEIKDFTIKRNTERVIDDYLNRSELFGKPIEEYETRDAEEGAELLNKQEELEEEIEEENKEYFEGVEESALERLEQFEKKEMPLKDYIERLDRMSGRLNKEETIRRFIAREIFKGQDDGNITAVAEKSYQKLPSFYNDVFNTAWNLLMSMIKKDAGRITSTASSLAKGEDVKGLELDTAGIFSPDDVGFLGGMLGGLISGDKDMVKRQWMGFVMDKIENTIDLNEFVERYGDIETKALEDILPVVLTGEASAGVLKGLIQQGGREVGKGLSKSGDAGGAVAGKVAEELGKIAGEEAQDITSDIIKGSLEERLERRRQKERELEEKAERLEKQFRTDRLRKSTIF